MRNARWQLVAELAAGMAGVGPETFRQIDVVEQLTRPGFGPRPNKYKPHQGKREMQRRAKKIKVTA